MMFLLRHIIIIGGIFSLMLAACSPLTYAPVSVDYSMLVVTAPESSATELETLIIPYRTVLSAEMDEVIGQCHQTLVKKQPEGSLGNAMVDLLLNTTEQIIGEGIDFAVLNYGGIRIPSLPQGAITKGKIFELMPFDNTVVVMTLDSITLWRLLDMICERGGWPISGGVLHCSGAQAFHLDFSKSELNYPVRVVLSDYLANGGDRLEFLKPLPRKDTGIWVRDMLIRGIEEGHQKGIFLDAMEEGRIQYVR